MATPNLTVYDFDEVTCVIGGVLVDGFHDGGISIEQEAETFTHFVGADGKVSRSKTLNRVAKVTLELTQTSAANLKLSALHLIDRDGPGGAGIVPILITDRSGTSVYAAGQGWISKPPVVTFKNGAEARVWEITVAKLDRVDGGN